MKIISLFLIFTIGSPSIFAADKKSAKEQYSAIVLPELLKEVELKYTQEPSLSAKFEQETEIKLLNQKKKSKGRLLAKRPDKMLWETTSPDPNTLVSDGKKYWYYTPPFEEGERGQVLIKKTSETQSELATALLQGRFSITKDVTFEQKGKNEFILHLKPGSAGSISAAEIKVDAEKKLISRVIIVHTNGNRSVIELSDILIGSKIEDDLFNFKIPKNTDIIE